MLTENAKQTILIKSRHKKNYIDTTDLRTSIRRLLRKFCRYNKQLLSTTTKTVQFNLKSANQSTNQTNMLARIDWFGMRRRITNPLSFHLKSAIIYMGNNKLLHTQGIVFAAFINPNTCDVTDTFH